MEAATNSSPPRLKLSRYRSLRVSNKMSANTDTSNGGNSNGGSTSVKVSKITSSDSTKSHVPFRSASALAMTAIDKQSFGKAPPVSFRYFTNSVDTVSSGKTEDKRGRDTPPTLPSWGHDQRSEASIQSRVPGKHTTISAIQASDKLRMMESSPDPVNRSITSLGFFSRLRDGLFNAGSRSDRKNIHNKGVLRSKSRGEATGIPILAKYASKPTLSTPPDTSNSDPTANMNCGERKIIVEHDDKKFPYTITPTTTADEVIRALFYRETGTTNKLGNLSADLTVLTEVFVKVDIQRPLRGYERILDVLNTWEHDKENSLQLTGTTALPDEHIHTSKVPSARPSCDTVWFMYYSHRPGKWMKRFVSMREDGQIIISKDSGTVDALHKSKNSVSVCHLSDFDVYNLRDNNRNKRIKTPKRYCYAVKSQSKASVFMSKDTFVHFFCTNELTVAHDFYEKVHAWRTWYLVHILGKGQHPEPVASGGSATATTAGTRYSLPHGTTEVNSTTSHNANNTNSRIPTVLPFSSGATVAGNNGSAGHLASGASADASQPLISRIPSVSHSGHGHGHGPVNGMAHGNSHGIVNHVEGSATHSSTVKSNPKGSGAGGSLLSTSSRFHGQSDDAVSSSGTLSRHTSLRMTSAPTTTLTSTPQSKSGKVLRSTAGTVTSNTARNGGGATNGCQVVAVNSSSSSSSSTSSSNSSLSSTVGASPGGQMNPVNSTGTPSDQPQTRISRNATVRVTSSSHNHQAPLPSRRLSYRHTSGSTHGTTATHDESHSPSHGHQKSNSNSAPVTRPLVDLTPTYRAPPQHQKRGRGVQPTPGQIGRLVDLATSPDIPFKTPQAYDWRATPSQALPPATTLSTVVAVNAVPPSQLPIQAAQPLTGAGAGAGVVSHDQQTQAQGSAGAGVTIPVCQPYSHSRTQYPQPVLPSNPPANRLHVRHA